MSRFHAPAVLAAGLVAAVSLTVGTSVLPAFAAEATTGSVIGRAGQPAPLRGTDEPGALAGRYIVVLRSTPAATPGSAVRTAVDSAVDVAENAGADVTHTYDATIHGYAATMTAAELAKVRQDPAVAYVEADRRITLQGTRNSGSWGQDRIDQRSGLNGKIITAGTGAGVTAYVIDTGIRSTHHDFGGRVAAGYSSVADSNGTEDCNGHGTHVAGTIGSDTYGVAPGVTLVPVRVLDCNGSASSSGVIAGVEWVTSHHVANSVANLSLGGTAFSALDNAVQASIASGVTYVVAAGNSTEDACNESPARLPEAITVAASTQSDGVAGFSNFGTCVDLYAPGQYIVSTVNTSDTATASYSGTSMAAPHVAGAAALYLQAHPGSSPAAVSAALVGDATAGALTGVPSGTPNLLLYVGVTSASGDAAAGGTTSSAPSPTTPSPTTPSPTTPSPTTPSPTTPSPSTPSPTTNPGTTPTTTPTTGTTKPAVKPKTGKAYCRALKSQGALSVQSAVVAGKTFTTRRKGTSYGCLTGAKKADFDLILQKRKGSTWKKVARGGSASADESVAYTGTAGKYRWQVLLVKGSGSYSLQVSYPT